MRSGNRCPWDAWLQSSLRCESRGRKTGDREGRSGKARDHSATSRGPQPPPIEYVKVSGGQMRDQTIHFFDLLRWQTSDEPVEMYAIGGALAERGHREAGDV